MAVSPDAWKRTKVVLKIPLHLGHHYHQDSKFLWLALMKLGKKKLRKRPFNVFDKPSEEKLTKRKPTDLAKQRRHHKQVNHSWDFRNMKL